MKPEAELRVMQPQAAGAPSRQMLEAAKDSPSERGLWPTDTVILNFWPPELWKNKYRDGNPRELTQPVPFYDRQGRAGCGGGGAVEGGVWILAMDSTRALRYPLKRVWVSKHETDQLREGNHTAARQNGNPESEDFSLSRSMLRPGD